MAGGLCAALRRFWNALPIDGRGFLPPDDADARLLMRFANRKRLGPAWPVTLLLARLLWPLKAIGRVRRAAHTHGFGSNDAWLMYADACLHGLYPKDSVLWRGPLGTPRRPLSPESFSKIQSAVGDPGQRRILSDKLATATLLERLGVPVPKLVAVIAQGSGEADLPDNGDLFVKPKTGSRSRDAFRISAAEQASGELRARLRQAAARDDLLVQRCLTAAPELADLATGGVPPVLRLITACEPGGRPFLHSAWLAIRIPGESGGHILRGVMRVPVSIAEGRLMRGCWLGAPDARFERSPWHEAPILGRIVPGFAAATEAALAAARAFDRLPTIGWDVVSGDAGPVILEGNSHTDWLLITLAGEGAPDAPPLLPLLRRWAEAG